MTELPLEQRLRDALLKLDGSPEAEDWQPFFLGGSYVIDSWRFPYLEFTLMWKVVGEPVYNPEENEKCAPEDCWVPDLSDPGWAPALLGLLPWYQIRHNQGERHCVVSAYGNGGGRDSSFGDSLQEAAALAFINYVEGREDA